MKLLRKDLVLDIAELLRCIKKKNFAVLIDFR